MGLMTYSEAAQYLGRSVGAMYRLVHEGKIAYVPEGKRGVRFRKRDLDAFEREAAEARLGRVRTQDDAGIQRLVAEAQELLPDPPEKLSLWTLREVGLYRGTVKVLKGPGDSEADALRKLARLAWPDRSFKFENRKGQWQDPANRRRHVAEVARDVLGRAPRSMSVEDAKIVAPHLSKPVSMAAGGAWKLLHEYDPALPKARPIKKGGPQ
jgi:excisionase family DNA binding protein